MLAIWSKMTLYPLKRLILRAQILLSRSCRHETSRAICGAVLARCGADAMDESAWAHRFSDPGRRRSLRRLAPPEPMKLLSEPCIRRWALASF